MDREQIRNEKHVCKNCGHLLRYYDIGFDDGWKCDGCGMIWECEEIRVAEQQNGG